MSVVTVQKRSAERPVVTHLDEVDGRTSKQLEELTAVQRDVALQRIEERLPVRWVGVVDGLTALPLRIWTAHPNTHYEDLGGAVLDDRWMVSHEGTRSPMVRTKSWLLRAISTSNAILSPPLWHWSLMREVRSDSRGPSRYESVWKRIS